MRQLVSVSALFLLISSGAWATDAAQDAFSHGNYATAFALWQPRAAAGDPQAQTAVGSLFAYGRGVAKDDDQAAFWFRKAAEQNYPPGQFALGGMFLQGRGVPADASQAAFWIEKAAEKDLPDAQLFLSAMYEGGIGVSRDDKKAKYWKEKADTGLRDILPMLMPKQ